MQLEQEELYFQALEPAGSGSEAIRSNSITATGSHQDELFHALFSLDSMSAATQRQQHLAHQIFFLRFMAHLLCKNIQNLCFSTPVSKPSPAMQGWDEPQPRLVCHRFRAVEGSEDPEVIRRRISNPGPGFPSKLVEHGLIRQHPFTTQLQLTLAAPFPNASDGQAHVPNQGQSQTGTLNRSQGLPSVDELWKLLGAPHEGDLFHYRVACSWTDLLRPAFLDAYVRPPHRQLFLWTARTSPGSGNSACICGDGVLRFSVDRGTYQRLGLAGGSALRVRPYGERFLISIDLAAKGFRPGRPAYDRALWCLGEARVGRAEFLACVWDHQKSGCLELHPALFGPGQQASAVGPDGMADDPPEESKQSPANDSHKCETSPAILCLVRPGASSERLTRARMGRLPDLQAAFDDCGSVEDAAAASAEVQQDDPVDRVEACGAPGVSPGASAKPRPEDAFAGGSDFFSLDPPDFGSSDDDDDLDDLDGGNNEDSAAAARFRGGRTGRLKVDKSLERRPKPPAHRRPAPPELQPSVACQQVFNWAGLLACGEWELLRALSGDQAGLPFVSGLSNRIRWLEAPAADGDDPSDGHPAQSRKRQKRSQPGSCGAASGGSSAAVPDLPSATSVRLSQACLAPAVVGAWLAEARRLVDSGRAGWALLQAWGEPGVPRAWGGPEKRRDNREHLLGGQGEAECELVYGVLPGGRYIVWVAAAENETGA